MAAPAIPAGYNDGGRATYEPYGTLPGAPIASKRAGVLEVTLAVTTWKRRKPEGYRVRVCKTSTRQCLRNFEFVTLSEAILEYEGSVQDARRWAADVDRGVFLPFN